MAYSVGCGVAERAIGRVGVGEAGGNTAVGVAVARSSRVVTLMGV